MRERKKKVSRKGETSKERKREREHYLPQETQIGEGHGSTLQTWERLVFAVERNTGIHSYTTPHTHP